MTRRLKVAGALLLVGLSSVIVTGRALRADWPGNRDVCAYAVVGHEILNGKKLYAGIWDHKPPAVHVAYVLAEVLCGYGPAQFVLLSAATSVLGLLLVYGLAIREFRAFPTGALAALVWTLLSFDIGLELWEPNCEVFVNSLILLWFFVISGATEETARTRHLLGGLVLAAATSFKPNAILIVAPIIASGLLLPPRNIRRRVFFSGILVEGMVVGIWWLALVAVFWFQNTLRAFFNAVFLFNAGYAGDVWQNLKASLEPQNILVIRYPFLLPLLLLFLGGLLYGIGRGRHRRWAHLAAWFIGAYLGASVLGRFYAHYYQYYLPPLVIGSAWALEEIRNGEWLRDRFLVLGAVVLVAVLAAHELPGFVGGPGRHCSELYLETQRLGRRVGELTSPGDFLYEWGAEPGFFFYSRRRPSSRFFFDLPLVEGPFQQAFTRKAIGDLELRPPKYVLFAGWFVEKYGLDHPLPEFLLGRCGPAPGLATKTAVVYRCRRPGP